MYHLLCFQYSNVFQVQVFILQARTTSSQPLPAPPLHMLVDELKTGTHGSLCLDDIIFQSIEQPDSGLEEMLKFKKSLLYCNQCY